ncbi:MAG: metallophosphoesterase family protein [Aggregatilineales bacterium]
MTRLAVLADIHGNLPALEAVFEDMKQFTIDQVVVAGDVVNLGPFSRQVMERLAAEHCTVMRGNHELYVTSHSQKLAWPWPSSLTIEQLGAHWLDVITAWPDTLTLNFRDAPTVRVVHGSPHSPYESILPTMTDTEIEDMLTGVKESTVIAAHTHLALDRQVGGWHLLNPGSVGAPIDGILAASYLILDGNQAGWHGFHRRVPFDSERILREFERIEFIARCGVVGQRVVEQYHSARPELYAFLEWRRAICPDAPLTMALLEPYSKVNRFDFMLPAYRVNLPEPAPQSIA